MGLVGGGGSPHRVHDHACCHLQADCLESGISSGPLRSTMSMGTFTEYLLEASAFGGNTPPQKVKVKVKR